MNLDDFHVQIHLWPLLGLHWPTPACIHSLLGPWASFQVLSQKSEKMRAWGTSVDHHGLLYKSQGTGAFSCCPKPSCKWLASCSTSLLSICSFSCFKSIRKRKNNFCISPFLWCSCFLSLSLQERVCGGTTTPQERFWGADSPTRTILWRVIIHKDDCCERQPSPARTINFSDD